MLSLSEALLFVWGTDLSPDLVMSRHASHFSNWEEKNFSNRSVVVGQKILVSKKGCIMGWVSFLKGVQGIFG